MDTLSVTTAEGVDDAFVTRWKWRQSGAKQPLTGEIIARLDESYKDDRAIIAELGAIHYLLEDRHIHGANRLGASIKIEVSFGAIRKALLKGSLKKSDRGDTEKKHVAGCATFLATKYFEADIAVLRKWRDEDPKTFESAEIAIPETFPGSTLFCHLLGEDVFITRHAMRRQIARLDTKNPDKPKPITKDDLSNIPDKWWGTAWGWFENIFKEGSNLRRVKLLPKWHAYYVRKYGPGSQYLWHPDSQGVVIVKRDHGSLVVATVIHDEYAAIERDPVQVGQHLVSHQVRKARATSPT
ncbi:hypothetical protein [Azovibrio restrictus]|jgi:hypothetical protein|uniref:hypothetical protein n=1 Tax=Azovibrio restrictus TaxID=146938 RepID=UPI0026F2C6E0|nr:hypothetical protein [Azovibrio restrictus]